MQEPHFRLAEALSQLDQLTNWEQRPRGEMRVGLEPIVDLSARLGDPHRAFRSIHVAGTKGKSSTCALLEAGLRHAGISVGRYASPHVKHISERVTVNGWPVEDQVLAEALFLALDALKAARRDATAAEAATWFDMLTAAAFLIFRDAGIQWAVVETGLGGRLDSTNIVDSDISIITNIGLEHTEILGKTRAAIAFEKAGIIKSRTIVVTPLEADDEAGAVIAKRAAEIDVRLIQPDFSGLKTIAERNIAVAGAALDALGEFGLTAREGEVVGGWLIDEQAKLDANLPGRMERFVVPAGGRAVAVAIDGAHVPFNLEAVLDDLSGMEGFSGPGIAVVAIAGDKDAAGFVEVMARYGVSPIFTSVSDRFRSPAELQALAKAMGLESEVIEDPKAAYEKALDRAGASGAWVILTGSLYLAGLLRDHVMMQDAMSRKR
ncbi:bifunctional folylpolyglutamate synthase/dihydrofolate synthase [Rhizobium mesosinicum]|uniref:Dihydrofolate synthase/folylpolyglutamate synthase n=2 Tax=Rhizobium mesosinicum TaxID=335017 RepID=A0ABS7GZD4_9HYPH|nr:Mur ligase family protein [Rhizobium mesosinicum]MBW9055304.1 bifunctional folylpolyglutamate synthase/dihydrofolate synthase [Rhizobium mesosinicum]